MPEPEEPPLGGLLAGAITMHEMLLSYIQAGFSRKEAMDLVKTTVYAMARNAARSD